MVGLPFVGRTTSPPSPRIAPPDEVLLVELLPPGNLLPAWKLLVPDSASCSSPFHRRLLPPLVLKVNLTSLLVSPIPPAAPLPAPFLSPPLSACSCSPLIPHHLLPSLAPLSPPLFLYSADKLNLNE